jgi:hypothetical protein
MSTSKPIYRPQFDNGVAGTYLTPDCAQVATAGVAGIIGGSPNPSVFSDMTQEAVNGFTDPAGPVVTGYLPTDLAGTATTVAANANFGAVLCALGAALDTFNPNAGPTSVSGGGANQVVRDKVKLTFGAFLAALRAYA